MPLWAHYQQCLVTTDPTELVLIIDRFERVMLAGAEPPSWMRAWGDHVMSQPLRTAVDPHALIQDGGSVPASITRSNWSMIRTNSVGSVVTRHC